MLKKKNLEIKKIDERNQITHKISGKIFIFTPHGLEETILLRCQYANFFYLSKESIQFQSQSQQDNKTLFYRNQKTYSKIYVRRQKC